MKFISGQRSCSQKRRFLKLPIVCHILRECLQTKNDLLVFLTFMVIGVIQIPEAEVYAPVNLA